MSNDVAAVRSGAAPHAEGALAEHLEQLEEERLELLDADRERYNAEVRHTSTWARFRNRLLVLWRRSQFSVKAISAYPSSVSLADFEDHQDQPCSHSVKEKFCTVYVIKGLLRGLAVGYGLKSAFTLAISLFSRQFLKRPLHVLAKAFISRDTLRFARFLGAMSFVYRILQCLFCRLRGRPGTKNSAMAAFLAGFTILLDSAERRATIASYLLVRALYEMTRVLVAYNKIPSVPYAVEGLFAVCQMPIMYSLMKRPDTLAPAYFKWIVNMANMSPSDIKATFSPEHPFLPCSSGYHQGGCVQYNFRDWLHGVFVRAVPIYAPVHLIPSLLFKRKHVFFNPLGFLREASVGILRSSLFLGTYTAIIKSITCFLRYVFQTNAGWVAFVGGFFTGAALFFEHPRRHAELLLYVMPRTFEITFNILQPWMPIWMQRLRANGVSDTLAFCLAMAAFVIAADTKPKLKGINASIFRLLFGAGTQMQPYYSRPQSRAESPFHGAPASADADADAVEDTLVAAVPALQSAVTTAAGEAEDEEEFGNEVFLDDEEEEVHVLSPSLILAEDVVPSGLPRTGTAPKGGL